MATSSLKLLTTILFTLCCTLVIAETEIHLQWAICDKDSQTVLSKLGKPHKQPYKAHEITYYDTSPPSHTTSGLALRTKVKGHELISVIKARFDDEVSSMPSSADCVWDQYGTHVSYTCGLSSPVSEGDLWSDEQVSFASQYHNVSWSELVPYGPYTDPKWKLHIKGYKAKFDDVVVETEHGTLHMMEIEVKVKSSKGHKAHKKISKYLKKHGVVLCDARQLPKTQRLFEFLESQTSMVNKQGGQALLTQEELK